MERCGFARSMLAKACSADNAAAEGALRKIEGRDDRDQGWEKRTAEDGGGAGVSVGRMYQLVQRRRD